MQNLSSNTTSISLGGMGLPNGAYQPNTSILIDLINLKGFKTQTEPTGDFYIAFDHEDNSYNLFIEHGGSVSKAILIRQETDAVYPGQYRYHVEQKYGLILTLGGTEEVRRHDFLGHPYMHSYNPANPTQIDSNFATILYRRKSNNVYELSNWKDRKIFLSFVGANKVGLNRKGNYGIRRRLVKELLPVGLEVYGILWNDGLRKRLGNRISMVLWGLKTHQAPPIFAIFVDLFRNYANAKGAVENKQNILLESKFSLVVENSDSIITEKLFDAILAGSIPVFYGGTLSRFGLPDGLAIEIKKYKSPIGEVIISMTESEIKQRLRIMKEFLGSKEFEDTWLAESVYRKVLIIIEKYLEVY